jgi:hypothetical protein
MLIEKRGSGKALNFKEVSTLLLSIFELVALAVK